MTEQTVKERGENTKISNQTTPKKKEDPPNELVCLHISKNSLSQQSLKYFSDIKVRVTECSDIQKAQDLCAGKQLRIILLDGEIDHGFVKNLKSKGSCNEQTPVIYIAHGQLEDDVKDLVKEQFIDDVLFQCSTLELDLIKAVKRLISEPLQFAVTPKSKKGESSTPKRQRLDKTPMSARRCIANDFRTIDVGRLMERQTPTQDMQPLPSDNMFINMDIASAPSQSYPNIPTNVFDQQYYNHYQTGGSMIGNPYNQIQQGSDTSNKMEMLTAAAEMSQALASIQTDMGNNKSTLGQESMQQPVLQPARPQQALPGNTNQMQAALQNAERAINSSFQEMLTDDMLPKITLSGARQLLDSALMGVQHITQQGKEQRSQTSTTSDNKGNSSTANEKTERNRSSQRGRRSGTSKDDKTPNNKNNNVEMSTQERKEIHLAKERQRRERIARSWYQLRKMIPLCDPSADKASVFEMTVAYVHHCWKHHPDKIQIINKDFQRYCQSNAPPESMDEMDSLVDELLTREEEQLPHL